VPWVESASASFHCRHSSAHADDAARLLALLERARDELLGVFPRTVDELTVVIHGDPWSLVASHPTAGLSWLVTAPAARRYLAGWVGRDELHVLAPSVLARRASGVAGSAQMLALAPASLYVRRVIVECNHDLHQARAPRRLAASVRWAWQLEGGSRWFSGETAHARGAIIRRLHEGRRPRFPPSLPDAPLLGGTVIDLIASEQGIETAAQFVTRLHPQGPRAALMKVFGGRSLDHTEGAWRSHLARLAGAG
jgi:hypothetical protein